MLWTLVSRANAIAKNGHSILSGQRLCLALVKNAKLSKVLMSCMLGSPIKLPYSIAFKAPKAAPLRNTAGEEGNAGAVALPWF